MQAKRKIKKYILAVVMLIIASFATVYIKDAVDAKNPEKSLPIISVSVGFNPPYVVRAGYTWSFGTQTVRSPYVDCSDVPLVVTECPAGEQIVINFSAPFDYYNVYRATGLANEDFTRQYNLVTPDEEGIYVYKIEAFFPDGDILYYFAVQTKTSNIVS